MTPGALTRSGPRCDLAPSSDPQAAFRLWFYPKDISDDPHTQAAVKAGLRPRIESIRGLIDAHLRAQGPHLLSEPFSAPDLMLIMLMRWSSNMPKPATDWAALTEYAARVKARESWKRLCALEGLPGLGLRKRVPATQFAGAIDQSGELWSAACSSAEEGLLRILFRWGKRPNRSITALCSLA